MKTDIKAALGARVRELRRSAGLTLEELAFRADMHPSYIGDMERGQRNVTLENLAKIAAGLHADPGSLLKTEPQKARSKKEKPDPFHSLAHALSKNSAADRQFILNQAKALSRRLRRRIK